MIKRVECGQMWTHIEQIILNFNITILNIYITGKLREFYFTKGSQDQFRPQHIQGAARNVLSAKLVKEARIYLSI